MKTSTSTRALVAGLLAVLGGCGGDDNGSSAPAPAPPPAAAQPTPVSVKAGPDLLYAAAPVVPQLQNTGVWTANPILISGTSAYRKGEFLYQDYLYDDAGAGAYTYPTNTAAYVGNLADFVEIRVKPLDDSLAIRITYNSMIDPTLVGTSIALGTSTASLPFPHGANVSAPAQVFVTTWGTAGDVVNAANGAVLGTPQVTVDTTRRQIEVRVPYAYYDPRNLHNARIAAGVGLWDKSTNNYLLPQTTADATHPGGKPAALATPPAFFNVAFRYLQSGGGDFRTGTQATALTAGDISPFFGTIDFVKLASGVDDNLTDTAVGAPSTGWLNRIYGSAYEKQQGRIVTGSRGSQCSLQKPCDPTYAGQLQPYSLYIPTKPMPAAGYGFTYDLHAAGGSHNSNDGPTSIAPTRQLSFGERGNGSLVATPLAHGTDEWYYGYGLADTFEVWADVMRNYKVDMTTVVSTGISMGGYGSYKLSTLWPDLFAAIATNIGCETAGTGMSSPTDWVGGINSAILFRVDSLRNVPATQWVGSIDPTCAYVNGQRPVGDKFKALNYRYEFRTFQGQGHANPPSFQDQADYLGTRTVVVNPSHITYVRNTDNDEPNFKIVADHAYWVSAITLRDTTSTQMGTLDVVSKGLGLGDAAPKGLVTGAGSVTATYFPYVFESRDWDAAPTQPAVDELDIKATNIASIVVDGTRAKISCSAKINVTSDGPMTVKINGCP